MHLTRNVISPLLHLVAPNRNGTLRVFFRIVSTILLVAPFCTESHRIRNPRDTISDTELLGTFWLLDGSL
jgi:hypothetical protein